MSTNDGDLPAFPFASDICGHHGGMTLRDAFALTALAGVPQPLNTLHDIDAAYKRTAEHCWRMADAMLAARATQGAAPATGETE